MLQLLPSDLQKIPHSPAQLAVNLVLRAASVGEAGHQQTHTHGPQNLQPYVTTLMLHWQEISYLLQGIKISLSNHQASIQWIQGTLYPRVATD
jgi:hypothetical protein